MSKQNTTKDKETHQGTTTTHKETPKETTTKTQTKGPAGNHVTTPGHKGGGASVTVLAGGCMADGCKKKSEKAGFCMEHFDWFKEGLITKEGRRPTDFDKKYFNYQQRRKPAA